MIDEQLPPKEGWERELLSKLAMEQLREQRTRRRWSTFFRLMWLLLIAAIVAGWMGWLRPGSISGESSGRHTALIKLVGEIDDKSQASSDKINQSLRSAFKAKDSAAVVLHVNSPGGSPVHSGRIYAEIRRLRAEFPDKPLYVVIDEICASGCYYVAAAADRIFADQASLVGSIGVIYQGFGLDKLIDKIGVENRTITAGDNKAFLDPLSPLRPEHKAHLESVLSEVHQQFIKAVREGRGNRLKETPAIFSGLVWNGSKALDLGLIDALGSVDQVARDVIKAEEIYDYTIEESPFDRLSRRLGTQLGKGLASALPWAGASWR